MLIAFDKNKNSFAYCIIVHPKQLSKAIDWLDEHNLTEASLSHNQMTALHHHLGGKGCWIIQQKHGDIIYISVSYGHAVCNAGPCVKVAMDA